jgi:transcription initiation factor TFIID TATA-box-binding protein
MAAIISHPQNAQQAKAFTSPASLSFPGGAGNLTPPSSDVEGQKTLANGQQGGADHSGAVITPATPAATPGGGPTVSGIVPTLQ